MEGGYARWAMRGIEVIAACDQDGDAIAPGIVDRHRGVLQSNGAVNQGQQRLSRRLEITVRHADRRFFVHAGEEFRLLVAAVVDQRFVQCAEARRRIAGQIFDVESLDDIDHEIGAGAAAFTVLGFLRCPGFGGRNLRIGCNCRGSGCWLGGSSRDRRFAGLRRHRRCSSRDGNACKEFPPVDIRARIVGFHFPLPSHNCFYNFNAILIP